MDRSYTFLCKFHGSDISIFFLRSNSLKSETSFRMIPFYFLLPISFRGFSSYFPMVINFMYIDMETR